MSNLERKESRKRNILPPLRMQCAILALGIFAWFGVTNALNHATAGDDTGEISSVERLITLNDNGSTRTFVTRATTISRVLEQQNVTIDSGDVINIEQSTELVDSNYTIEIQRARPVMIVDGANKQIVNTFSKDPKQIVLSAGIKTYPNDVITTNISNDISSGYTGLVVKIERNEYSDTITEDQDIPFSTETKKDLTKGKDFKEITTQGENGKKTVQYRVVVKNGKEISREIISETTIKEPVTQVETIGVKYSGIATTPGENEIIIWNYLLSQGFSRNQVAGIMGNLKQEHGFQTSGDGLAQWTGGRKAKLMALENPESIYTQLEFLMSELNGAYSRAKASIMASSTVEEAVIAFQNQYERCGYCMEGARIQFAYNILASH